MNFPLLYIIRIITLLFIVSRVIVFRQRIFHHYEIYLYNIYTMENVSIFFIFQYI